MKKIGVLFLVAILLVSFVAALDTEGLQEEMEGLRDAADPDNVKDKANEKWDYLQKEWTSILMKNKVVASIDSFLKQINIVFVVLFGEDYNLISLTLWLVIASWLVLTFAVANVLIGQFNLGSALSLFIGVIVSIILAQVRILNFIITFVLNLAFAPELWYVRLIIWAGILIGFFLILYLSQALSVYLKKARKKNEEDKTRHTRKKFEKFSKGAGI